jgi:hypothetical protein
MGRVYINISVELSILANLSRIICQESPQLHIPMETILKEIYQMASSFLVAPIITQEKMLLKLVNGSMESNLEIAN